MILHKTLRVQGLFLTAAMLISLFVQAETSSTEDDEIVLKNGSRLIGTVTGSRDGVLTIETEFAGTLSVAMDQIESVDAVEPVIVLMEDDSVHRDSSFSIREELLEIGSAGQAYPLQELRVINPDPWELGQGYRWTGAVSFALDVERGNTDKDELDVNVETQWRSTEDRYTFKWASENEKNNNEKTTDNWQTRARYDYFLSGPNYVGLLGYAEKDKFKDLELRYLAGPYLGRQFYDEPIFSLSGELGVSYVTEDFIEAEDQDYGASNWHVNVSTNYLGGDSSIYFDQLGIWNLKDTSDVVVNSTFGVSFPLLWNLEAAAEALFEYDSGAAENVDDLDQTLKVRVGYSWK